MTVLARIFVGLAMVAFGLQHLYYGEFVTRVAPRLPAWAPKQTLLAHLLGVVLVVAGSAIIHGQHARRAGIWLGALLLVFAVCLHAPRLAADPRNGGLWTFTGKGFMLAGAAFLAAGAAGALSRALLSGFLILGGIQHFLYASFVATLVPAWIPGHLFWTYFAGVALIAGGAGMLLTKTRFAAASLTALMTGLWVVLVHVPRALGNLRDSNETTAVFEALAVTGAALLVASARSVPVRPARNFKKTKRATA